MATRQEKLAKMRLEKARRFAAMVHKGQVDDNGKDYFKAHISPVVEAIRLVAPKDKNLMAAAYLHDVIEDCGVKYSTLVKMFGKDISSLVMEVTHDGTKDEHGYYFPRLRTQRGIMLKFADRLSNLSRMDNWDAKRKEQYLKKSRFWNDRATHSYKISPDKDHIEIDGVLLRLGKENSFSISSVEVDKPFLPEGGKSLSFKDKLINLLRIK